MFEEMFELNLRRKGTLSNGESASGSDDVMMGYDFTQLYTLLYQRLCIMTGWEAVN